MVDARGVERFQYVRGGRSALRGISPGRTVGSVKTPIGKTVTPTATDALAPSPGSSFAWGPVWLRQLGVLDRMERSARAFDLAIGAAALSSGPARVVALSCVEACRADMLRQVELATVAKRFLLRDLGGGLT